MPGGRLSVRSADGPLALASLALFGYVRTRAVARAL